MLDDVVAWGQLHLYLRTKNDLDMHHKRKLSL